MADDRMLSDEILLGIINSKSGGGGGGSTDDYNDLKNQPQINNHTLVGNKTASDLGLVAAETGKVLSSNDYTDADKAIVGGVTAALAGKQNALTAGSHIAIDDDTISVNRWFVPAGKVVYTVITSDENYGQNVHVQRHTISGDFIDDRVYTIRTWENATVDGLIYIEDRYTKFYITLLKDSDEHSTGYQYIVNPNTTPTSNSFTFVMPQEENDNDLIIREELDAVSYAVSAIKDGTNIDSFADVETALALKQDATDNNLDTTAKTIVGAINEHEGDIDSLKSGLTNYQTQNDLNLEVPNRKNVLPITLAGIKAANPRVTWTDNACTINGVTYTIQTDSDGKVTGITASGTANSNADLYLYSNMDSFLSKCAGMIFNGVTDGSVSTYGIGLYNKGIQVTTGDVTITTDLATAPAVYIRVNNGITVNDVVFTPMIRPATITDPTFAPYIPSVESRIEAVESGVANLANPIGTYNVMGIFQTSQLYNNSYGIAVVTGFDPSIHTATINSASTLDGTELTLTYNPHSTKKGVVGFFVADATVLGKIVNINITVS